MQCVSSTMRDQTAPPDPAAARAGAIIQAGLVNPALRPQVKAFFDAATYTVSYVVRDPSSAACAIIDSAAADRLPEWQYTA